MFVSIFTWIHGIVKVSPLVHPHLGNSGRVLVDDLGDPAGERVRGLVPENVAHVGTGNNLQDASALPNLDRVE